MAGPQLWRRPLTCYIRWTSSVLATRNRCIHYSILRLTCSSIRVLQSVSFQTSDYSRGLNTQQSIPSTEVSVPSPLYVSWTVPRKAGVAANSLLIDTLRAYQRLPLLLTLLLARPQYPSLLERFYSRNLEQSGRQTQVKLCPLSSHCLDQVLKVHCH